nr:unnamed protein product [Callosobruchus analis]
MKCIVATIFVVSVIFAVCENASAECGPNENVPQCKPCSVTCADLDIACAAVCTPNSRCYCKPGYLRKNGVSCEGACGRCGPNEAVPICEPCPQTCEDRDKICLAVCTPTSQCHCKSGYLRKNGVCVPRSQSCGPNEFVPQCEPCAITCADRDVVACPYSCIFNSKCYCKYGYLKKDDINKCILVSACGPNEYVPQCIPCAITCADSDKVACPEICIFNSHCYCKDGYLRKDACGPNEDIPQCRPCIVTCAERSNLCPAICTFNSQCYCKYGYLKKDACGPDESFPDCRPCKVTCAERDIVACSYVCFSNSECICKDGYLKKDACEPNEYIPQCEPCPITCADRDKVACPETCIRNYQCRCSYGYLKKGAFIFTIFVVSVIFAVCENATAACGPNENVPQCRPCAVTCADRNKVCTAVCTPNSQCYCRNGYLKKGGVCVPISKC